MEGVAGYVDFFKGILLLHGRPKKVVVAPEPASAPDVWMDIDPGTGIRHSSLHLHRFLK